MTAMFMLFILIIAGMIAFETSLIGESRNHVCAIIRGIFSTVLYLLEFSVILFSIYYIIIYAYNGTTDAREVGFFVGFVLIPLYYNYGRMSLGDNSNVDTSDWFWWIIMGLLSFSTILVWNVFIFNY